MKNKISLIFALFILAAAVLGCSSMNPFSSDSTSGSSDRAANKTVTDKAVDTAVGERKIGVPECDEVVDMLAAEADNPDDNFVAKAAKAVVINKIRDSVRESVEKNKNDKEALAKNCREFKMQLDKFKAQEEAK